MGFCRCDPPALLHITPDGVHAPVGEVTTLQVVDETWADGSPQCTVCATPIGATFYRCGPCDAVICRDCVGVDTRVVECDCHVEMFVSGVQLAARRAAAQLSATSS